VEVIVAATILLVLIVVQMAAIGVGAAVAVFEIESIVVSGPILSLSGLVSAAWCAARGRTRGLYFSASVPTIAVVCFALINGLGWGPSQAQTPIATLLVVFAAASIPLGVFALREADGWANVPKRGPVQFRIATLLWLMAAVSLPLALFRLGPAGPALAVLAAYALMFGYVLRSFHLRRREVERHLQPSRKNLKRRPTPTSITPWCSLRSAPRWTTKATTPWPSG
jgi:hypothetical protein